MSVNAKICGIRDRATLECAIEGGATAVGFVFYGGFMATAAWYIREQTGVVVDPWAGHSVLALGPLGILTLGTLAGIVPAAKAYGTDVAENLLPQS